MLSLHRKILDRCSRPYICGCPSRPQVAAVVNREYRQKRLIVCQHREELIVRIDHYLDRRPWDGNTPYNLWATGVNNIEDGQLIIQLICYNESFAIGGDRYFLQ
jgi:hypothetical protein